MKKFATTLLVLLTVMAEGLSAQEADSSVRSVVAAADSAILGTRVPYSAYFPSGYASSTDTYPVVYLLHGAGGDETSWIEQGDLREVADTLMAEGSLPPTIFIMPDGRGSRYLNNHDNSARYEDFFFDELIPHIESTYRVAPGSASRAVMGSSMGGYGSLMYALRHPDAFAAAVSFSGSFCEDDRILAMSVEEWNQSTRGPAYGLDLDGHARFTEHYREWDPCHFIQNSEPGAFENVRLYLDCGDDDFRNDGNARLHILMRRLGIAHEYRVRNGGHGWDYYRSGLANGLEFVAASLSQGDQQ